MSRDVLDLSGTEDLMTAATDGRHLTGSTMTGWIDQMILIIDTIPRSTSCIDDRCCDTG